jgi:hypothetical protein
MAGNPARPWREAQRQQIEQALQTSLASLRYAVDRLSDARPPGTSNTTTDNR